MYKQGPWLVSCEAALQVGGPSSCGSTWTCFTNFKTLHFKFNLLLKLEEQERLKFMFLRLVELHFKLEVWVPVDEQKLPPPFMSRWNSGRKCTRWHWGVTSIDPSFVTSSAPRLSPHSRFGIHPQWMRQMQRRKIRAPGEADGREFQ